MADSQEDTDFRVQRVYTTDVKPGFSSLHLPEDLSGKKVLELFSGDDPSSLKAEIEGRNGEYASLDLFHGTGDFGFVMDATKELPFLHNSFDYVLFSSPPVWQGERNLNNDMVVTVLVNSLSVLKREQGSFVGGLMHLNNEAKDKLADVLTKDPRFEDYTVIFEDTGVPASDSYSRPIGGNQWSLRVVAS